MYSYSSMGSSSAHTIFVYDFPQPKDVKSVYIREKTTIKDIKDELGMSSHRMLYVRTYGQGRDATAKQEIPLAVDSFLVRE